MEYEKIQYAPLHYILIAPAAVMLLIVWLAALEPDVAIVLVAAAAVMALVGLMFRSMTVRDEGDALAIRYGPLPVFRKRIRYDEITAVEPGRTSIIDGWGIHYIPWRGATYNLWGFGCAKVWLGRKVIRVGSDDVDNLVAFLRERTDVGGRTA